MGGSIELCRCSRGTASRINSKIPSPEAAEDGSGSVIGAARANDLQLKTCDILVDDAEKGVCRRFCN